MTVLIIVEVSLIHESRHQKDLFRKPKHVNFTFRLHLQLDFEDSVFNMDLC